MYSRRCVGDVTDLKMKKIRSQKVRLSKRHDKKSELYEYGDTVRLRSEMEICRATFHFYSFICIEPLKRFQYECYYDVT